MMTLTWNTYGLSLESLVTGLVDVVNDPMYCMLVTSGYTFSQNAHKFKSVVSGELTGSGYTAGGQHVAVGSPSYWDSVNKRIVVPASNLVWPGVTWVGATGAILYMNPADTADSAKPLLSYVDFGGPVDRTSQAFYLNWPSTGVITLAVP